MKTWTPRPDDTARRLNQVRQVLELPYLPLAHRRGLEAMEIDLERRNTNQAAPAAQGD